MAGILDTPSKPRAIFFLVCGLAILGMGLFDGLTSVFTVALECERAGEATRCVIDRSSATSSTRLEVPGVKAARIEVRDEGTAREHHQLELLMGDKAVPVVEGFRLARVDAERMQKAVEGVIGGAAPRISEGAEAQGSRRLGGIGFGLFFFACFASAAWMVRPRNT